MKTMRTGFLTLFAACLLSALPLSAGGFRMNWSEVEVLLDKDGKAQVSYTVRWTATGGQLHGFYFEGFQETPVFDTARAHALDAAGNRYPLEIKRLSDKKYDIILADGRAFTNGELTYFFRYAADLEASGNVTQTMSGDKRLTVFNWSPVQWEDPLDHQAVVVRFPLTAPAGGPDETFLQKTGFMTEKFVNERYMIDYPGVKNPAGENIFSARFFRKNLSAKYHFQIQVYLGGEAFALKTMAYGNLLKGPPQKTQYMPAQEKHYLNRYFPGGMLASLPVSRGETVFLVLLLGGLFCVVPFFIMTVKQNSMLTAQAGIGAVNWEGNEWVPPKVQVGTFRKPGKVASNLTPIEVGVLVGMPIAELLSLILANMERKGLLTVQSSEPLNIKRAPYINTSNDAYETVLLNAVRPDGTLETGAMNETVKTISTGLEQKMWDCDLAATKEYYQKRLEKYSPGAAETDADFYWGGYRRRYHHYQSPVYNRADAALKDITAKTPELNASDRKSVV